MRFLAVEEVMLVVQVKMEMRQPVRMSAQLPIELYARIGANVSAFPG